MVVELPILMGSVVIGFIAACISTLAGGGSLLTLPFLMMIELPSHVANGTNRLLLFSQCFSAFKSFHKDSALNLRLAIVVCIPSVFGAYVGSQLAIGMSDEIFTKVLTIMMVAMFTWALFGNQVLSRMKFSKIGLKTLPEKLLFTTIFFLVGIYGGMIQAGVGFVIVALMNRLYGENLVGSNAIKVFVILIFTIVALINYVPHGYVDWRVGGALSLGAVFGGWVGARMSFLKGSDWLQKVLRISMATCSVLIIFRTFSP